MVEEVSSRGVFRGESPVNDQFVVHVVWESAEECRSDSER
jgi:hypothetical protein